MISCPHCDIACALPKEEEEEPLPGDPLFLGCPGCHGSLIVFPPMRKGFDGTTAWKWVFPIFVGAYIVMADVRIHAQFERLSEWLQKWLHVSHYFLAAMSLLSAVVLFCLRDACGNFVWLGIDLAFLMFAISRSTRDVDEEASEVLDPCLIMAHSQAVAQRRSLSVVFVLILPLMVVAGEWWGSLPYALSYIGLHLVDTTYLPPSKRESLFEQTLSTVEA